LSLDVVLTFSAIGTEIALVTLLLRKATFKAFPIFCAYLVWDVLDNIGLYAILRIHPAGYFVAYLAVLAIDSVFWLVVLMELAWSVLRPLHSALPRGAIVVVGLLMGVVCAAIWPFAHSVAYGLYGPQSRLLLHLEQTVAMMRILFFLVLTACSHLLSINWRDREMQIATGLGFFSFVYVAVSILQAGQVAGSLYNDLARLAMLSYICSLVYWLVSFSKEVAPRREFTPQMQSFLLAVAGAARSTRISLADAQSQNARRRDGR
jgi:hypothetical protein